MNQAADATHLNRPGITDAAAMWQLAQDSGGLDINSPYLYLIWCRDFADTSIAARDTSGRLIGFIIDFRRPHQASAQFIGQIAVEAAHRHRGLGSQMLDHLIERGEVPATALEASVTSDNPASGALFDAFARRHGTSVARSTLFRPALFPHEGKTEGLLHIDLSRNR